MNYYFPYVVCHCPIMRRKETFCERKNVSRAQNFLHNFFSFLCSFSLNVTILILLFFCVKFSLLKKFCHAFGKKYFLAKFILHTSVNASVEVSFEYFFQFFLAILSQCSFNYRWSLKKIHSK